MFPKEFAQAETPAKKQELARTLLDNASRIKADAEVRYVMLTEAETLAVAAGQVTLASESAEQLAKHFDVDAITAKADALEQLAKSARSAAVHRDVVAAALETAKTAYQASRFEDSERLALLAPASARRAEHGAGPPGQRGVAGDSGGEEAGEELKGSAGRGVHRRNDVPAEVNS